MLLFSILCSLKNVKASTWSWRNKTFFPIFQYSPRDINALVATMLKHCNPSAEEGGVLVDQKWLHNCFQNEDRIWVAETGRNQMKLSWVSKGVGVVIQRHSWLLQPVKPELFERERYPGARAHLRSTFSCILTW